MRRRSISVQCHIKHDTLGIYVTQGWIFQGATSALPTVVTALGRFPGKLHAQPQEPGQTFSLPGWIFLFYFSQNEAEWGSGEKNSLLALTTAREQTQLIFCFMYRPPPKPQVNWWERGLFLLLPENEWHSAAIFPCTLLSLTSHIFWYLSPVALENRGMLHRESLTFAWQRRNAAASITKCYRCAKQHWSQKSS